MLDRAGQLGELSERRFDVLVIGGGITGAGIARDAVLRGLSTALVDRGDFGSGTSSRSSRLVHGGVRYLEHGHIHLVFEASAERRRLLRLAPHLVRPLAFTWPVYRGQRIPLWKLSAGLTLYDALALFRNVGRHRRLPARDVTAQEPRLRHRELRGAVRYWDAATDDARLTLANALDARALGAITTNYVAFLSASETDREGFRVARVRDTLTDQGFEIRARVLVNATGPWSNTVRDRDDDAPPVQVQGSKGAHISVRRERIGNREAITLLHPDDGRVFFVLPSGSQAIIGTTDTFTDIPPDEIRASRADVEYLLDAANRFFPDARLTADDVIAAWAGIRPLMPTRRSSVAASREHAVSVSPGGTIAITGGKLTTYRVMARDVVDEVQKSLRHRRSRPATDRRPLPGADVEVSVAIKEAQRLTGDVARATRLVHAYGGAWRDVQAYCERDAASAAAVSPGLPYRMGELRWCVERELACTLGDLLIRRAHVAFETTDNGREAARRVAGYLGWGDDALARYDAEVARMFSIDP